MSLGRAAVVARSWAMRLPHRLHLGRLVRSVPGLRMAHRPLMNWYLRLVKRAAPRLTEVEGHLIWVDPLDTLDLISKGTYEPFSVELATARLQPGDVVVDIGANIGHHSLCFARAVGPQGRVYCFEPDPENHALLKRNAQANGYGNVIAEQKAVSDRTGTLRLYQSDENRGDHRIFDPHDGRASVEVATVRLDDYFAEQDGPISLIKMDIQGAKYAALQGMRGLIERNPGVCLLIEFWPWGLKGAGVDPADFLTALLRLGFTLREVDGTQRAVRPVTPDVLLAAYPPASQAYTDLLCVREP